MSFDCYADPLSPDKILGKEEDRETIQRLLGRLGERERTVIVGLFFEGKTKKCLANRLKVSAPRVYQLELQALRKLRKYIIEFDFNDENIQSQIDFMRKQREPSQSAFPSWLKLFSADCLKSATLLYLASQVKGIP